MLRKGSTYLVCYSQEKRSFALVGVCAIAKLSIETNQPLTDSRNIKVKFGDEGPVMLNADGGEVSVESEPDKGSTFTVFLMKESELSGQETAGQ